VQFTTGSESAPAENTDPAWSLVDNQAYFASNRFGSFDIFRTEADGTGLTRITALPGDELHPTVSSDGGLLAFQYRLPGGRWDIALLNLGDGADEPLVLTAGSFNDTEPEFSSTISNQIVFTSDRSDPRGLFMMNSDGTNLRELDRSFGSVQYAPALHPLLDTQLLFTSNRGGSQDVWRKTISAIDGSTVNLNLTPDDLSEETAPDFAADASYFIYLSDYSGDTEVWLAEANGEFPRQVTFLETQLASPQLSPVAGSNECLVVIPAAGTGTGIAVIDIVSGNLLRWITQEAAN
jgi:Tol biopolymer transport system component